MYGHGHSEQLLGTFLRGIPRHEFAVTSKVGYFTEPGTDHAMEPAHLRRRLEGTLERLGVDHLDVYSLHNADFGPGDALLEKVVATLRGFQEEGLIRSVGMRGPHRFAPERLTTEPGQREDKHARFRRHFAEIRPDVLAVRDNLLTPPSATDGIREFSAAHSVTVIVNKALGQGLLTGKHTAAAPRPSPTEITASARRGSPNPPSPSLARTWTRSATTSATARTPWPTPLSPTACAAGPEPLCWQASPPRRRSSRT